MNNEERMNSKRLAKTLISSLIFTIPTAPITTARLSLCEVMKHSSESQHGYSLLESLSQTMPALTKHSQIAYQ
jgi:hypothetical protein